jgi:hypothetical protein
MCLREEVGGAESYTLLCLALLRRKGGVERGVEGEDDGAGLVVDDEEGWGQGGAGVVEVTWWGPGWVKIGLVKDFDISWASESGVPDLESEF